MTQTRRCLDPRTPGKEMKMKHVITLLAAAWVWIFTLACDEEAERPKLDSDAVSDWADDAREGLDELIDDAADAAKDTVDAVSDRAQDATDRLNDATEGALEAAEETAEAARKKAREASDAAGDTLEDAVGR